MLSKQEAESWIRCWWYISPKYMKAWAGIIAGRLRERYHHPVFVLTKAEEGVKGSGRSIETYHMFENMCAVKECFSKFGGHKLAAGSVPGAPI